MLQHGENFAPDGEGFIDGPAPAADRLSGGDFPFPQEENKSSLSDGGDMFDFTKSEGEFDQKNLFKPEASEKEDPKTKKND